MKLALTKEPAKNPPAKPRENTPLASPICSEVNHRLAFLILLRLMKGLMKPVSAMVSSRRP